MREILQDLFQSIKASPSQSLQHGLKILVYLLLLQFTITTAEPNNLVMLAFYHLTRNLFLFGGVFVIAISSIYALKNETIPTNIVRNVFNYCFGTLITLYLIKSSSDSVYQNWQSNPRETLMLASGLVLTAYMVRRYTATPQVQYITQHPLGIASAYPEQSLSERDIINTALHEAGHALMYAASPSNYIPTIRIGRQGQYLGSVSSPNEHLIHTKTELRFQMQVCLAGAAAEALEMGEIYSGNIGDNKTYDHYAERVLQVWPEIADHQYLRNAQTPEDKLHNQAVIDNLYQADFAAVTAFLATNQSLLCELAQQLEKTGDMSAKEVRPYLDRAVVTESLTKDINLIEFM